MRSTLYLHPPRHRGGSRARYPGAAEGQRLLLRGLRGHLPARPGAVHQPLLRRGRADRAGGGAGRGRHRPVHRADRALREGVPAPPLARQGPRDQELLRDGGEPAADPGHRAAVHAGAPALHAAGHGRHAPACCTEPEGKYLIIDGQHRLAALQFYRTERPAEAAALHVPCIIFDGRSPRTSPPRCSSSSTPRPRASTRATWWTCTSACRGPRRTRSSRRGWWICSTREGDSPLRYRINRLGGRSRQEKWILQAELFNEIHRWVKIHWRRIERTGDRRPARRALLRRRARLPQGGGAGVGGRVGQRAPTWSPSRSP